MEKKFKIIRESTGLKDVDGMVEGGVPRGSIIGLSGPPGVGKSIFSLHFVLEGARAGEKSIYINLEEPRKNLDNMIGQMSFGKEFFDFEKKGLIVVRCFEYDEYERVQEDLFSRIASDTSIKRLVIDSFNCFFASNCETEEAGCTKTRRLVTEIFHKLRVSDITTFLTLERGGEGNRSYYNIPYLVDGIIELDFLDLGTIERRIFVPKMRWTNQCKESRVYDICEEGIKMGESDWGY